MRTRDRKRMKRPVALASVLTEYLERSGLSATLERTRLLDEWPGIVGDRISGVTEASEVRGDTLVVRVASSAWLNELTMMRTEIIKRINEQSSCPPVERILFTLAEDGPGRSRLGSSAVDTP